MPNIELYYLDAEKIKMYLELHLQYVTDLNNKCKDFKYPTHELERLISLFK